VRSQAHVETGPATLDSLIDLERVKNVRKALRKKYNQRSNVDKVFTQYDESNKGYLSVNDLCNQANKIGLAMTLNEAQVLIQSVQNEGNKGASTIDKEQFEKLVFSHDDAFDVDLEQMKPLPSSQRI